MRLVFRHLEHLCIHKCTGDTFMVKLWAIPNEPIGEVIFAVCDSCRKPFLQRSQHVRVEGVSGVLLVLRELLLNEGVHLRVCVPWDG